MPRTLFDEELARLHADLAEMGRRVDALMQDAIRCLKSMDRPLARRIVPRDAEINTMEKTIEHSCMNLLALQQPLARDLRVITATLKILTDMERVADQCADICEILSTVAGMAGQTASPRLLRMFGKARSMFAGALDAYLRRDAGRLSAPGRRSRPYGLRHGRRGGRAVFLLHPRFVRAARTPSLFRALDGGFHVHRQIHRADRRSRHQHRGMGDFCGDRHPSQSQRRRRPGHAGRGGKSPRQGSGRGYIMEMSHID